MDITYQSAKEVLAESGLLVTSSLFPSKGQGGVKTRIEDLKNGDIFIAYQGVRYNAHHRLAEVAGRGAGLVVLDEKKYLSTFSTPYLLVKDSRKAWAFLASLGWGRPEKSLTLFGVTGTNGKTSVMWYFKELMRALSEPCLTLGTLGAYFPTHHHPLSHTTPDPPELFEWLAKARDEGVTTVGMEVSSHSFVQGKIAPLQFAHTFFTSFSRDHLDFHPTFQAYQAAKLGIMNQITTSGQQWISSELARDQDIREALPEAKVYDEDLKVWPEKGGSKIEFSGREGFIPAMGAYSCRNFLAALRGVEALTARLVDPGIWRTIAPVPGRLEPVDPEGRVLVDYAHTPAALSAVLAALRPHTAGKLWVLFGCGGDRDRGKRPLMAQAAEAGADHVVVTTDNPRGEEPQAIIADILSGFARPKAVIVEPDRRLAIGQALALMGSEDCLAVCGKGHESYQEIKGVRYPFDDRLVVKEQLRIL